MSSPETPPALPPKPKRRLVGPLVIAAVVVVALIVAGAIALPRLGGSASADTASGGGDSGDAKKTVTVKIGTTSASDPQWTILKRLAAAKGIDIETVNFTEYTLPNPALASGDTDLNSFQHLDFLSNNTIATGEDLEPIGSTVIVPLPLYSQKYDSVKKIPKGARIAIPNDPSNQGRAINVLKAAKLLTLKGDPLIPTPADIDASASRVTVIPVVASQTVAALQSEDGAIINNNFAQDANLDTSTALFSVDPKDPLSAPYLNVFVARAKDVNNPTYLEIVKLYHSKEVIDAVEKSSGNTAVVIDLPGKELRQKLADIIAEKKKAQADAG